MSKLLFTLVEILGILPMRQRKNQSLKIPDRIYAIFWIAFLISAYLYQLIERTRMVDTLNGALVIPGLCATLLLYSSNLHITGKFHLGDGRNMWDELLERLNMVDEVMGIHQKSKISRSFNFVKNLILIFGLLVVAVLTNTTHALLNFDDHPAYLFVDNLYRIRLSISAALICWTARKMQTALREIHSILINLLNGRFNVNLNKVGRKQFHTFNDLPTTFNTIARIHVALSECAAIFNHIYGFAIFLIDMYAISFFLVIFNAIRITMEKEPMDILEIILILLFVVATLTEPIWIAATCNQTAKESEKTFRLTYALLYNMKLSGRTPTEKKILKNLLLLVKQTSGGNFKFSAGGFFPVDYSGLYVIINLITSYAIVVLQF